MLCSISRLANLDPCVTEINQFTNKKRQKQNTYTFFGWKLCIRFQSYDLYQQHYECWHMLSFCFVMRRMHLNTGTIHTIKTSVFHTKYLDDDIWCVECLCAFFIRKMDDEIDYDSSTICVVFLFFYSTIAKIAFWLYGLWESEGGGGYSDCFDFSNRPKFLHYY